MLLKLSKNQILFFASFWFKFVTESKANKIKFQYEMLFTIINPEIP